MKYAVSIDVPDLTAGISFYSDALGFVESSRPVDIYVVLTCGDAEIGLLEKAPGTDPAPGCSDRRRYERHWTPVHIDFYVDDFEAAVQRAQAAGATCEQRFDAGDHPPAAFMSDPFGNGFCLIGRRA